MPNIEKSSPDAELAEALKDVEHFRFDDSDYEDIECHWVSDELVRLTNADSLVVNWDYYSQGDFSFCSNMLRLREHPAKTVYALIASDAPTESERDAIRGALMVHCGIELIFVADECLDFPGDADFIIHTDFMGEHEDMVEFSYNLIKHLDYFGE